MTWRSAADHIDAITEARERAADRAQKKRMDALLADAEKLRKEREARLAEIMRRTHCDECLDDRKLISGSCWCACHVGKLHAVPDLEDEDDV